MIGSEKTSKLEIIYFLSYDIQCVLYLLLLYGDNPFKAVVEGAEVSVECVATPCTYSEVKCFFSVSNPSVLSQADY